MQESISITVSELEAKKFQNFLKFYEIQKLILHSEKTQMLGNRLPRVCRFCNKSAPEVTFKKKAHVIPELLGNKHILSYFECDSCNSVFGLYENSLASFLGAMRTFVQLRGKRGTGIPVYKNEKTGFRAEVMENSVQISHHAEHKDEVEIELVKKSLTVKTIRPPYYPIHVFKTLSKIGFCLLDEGELGQFENTRYWLLSNTWDEKFKGAEQFRVFRHFIPGPPNWPEPRVTLFKKRENQEEGPIPEKVIMLYFGNSVFQYSLPFGKLDIETAKTSAKFSFHIAPVLLNKDRIETYGNYRFGSMKFSSPEKVIGEEDTITFSFENAVEESPGNDAQGI